MKIEANALRKDYIRKGSGTNLFTAVHETDLLLTEGQITAIRGRSGSGKSTLLNMLGGILTPTAGEVLYMENGSSGESTSLYRMDDEALSAFRNRHIGFIPQGTSAISSLTVEENILLPYGLRADAKGKNDRNSTPEQIMSHAGELMEELSIAHLAGEKPDRLSGGELRRMAIARALIMRPQVLLADEPTGDLDDENTKIVFTMMQRAAQQGVCVLIVTHEEDVEKYADTVYRMEAGRLKTTV